MFQSSVNWITGIFLIAMGLVHNIVGGRLVKTWLDSVEPPLATYHKTMGTAGFKFSGYLVLAIGLSFIVLGKRLPEEYYVFWAAVFLILGAISVYAFRAFHISQLLWLLTLLLGAFYWYRVVGVR